jgi:hypothetical protein
MVLQLAMLQKKAAAVTLTAATAAAECVAMLKMPCLALLVLLLPSCVCSANIAIITVVETLFADIISQSAVTAAAAAAAALVHWQCRYHHHWRHPSPNRRLHPHRCWWWQLRWRHLLPLWTVLQVRI